MAAKTNKAPKTMKAYLSITKMVNSETISIELHAEKKRKRISVSFEDFTRLITGQIIVVDIEETERSD